MTEEITNSEIEAGQTEASIPEKNEGTNAENVVQEEKVLKQSDVNALIGAVKREAYEKAKRDSAQEFEQRLSQQANTNQQEVSVLTDEKIRQLVVEEAGKAARLATAEKVVSDFTQKMLAAKGKHDDFEEVVTQLNLPNIPHIVEWTNSLDNTADVMYELGKNPAKFANVLMLASTTPHLAVSELKRLSSSIKKNQEALKSDGKASEPLSQIKPSPSGSDNGKMSIADYKKQPWLKA